jgi:hypothetical protein
MRRAKRRKSGPLKVRRPALAVRQHRRDDVGIVDLAGRERIAAAQHDEPVPDQRAILEKRELPNERRGVGDRTYARVSGFPQICGRVITERYSRKTSPLIVTASSAAARAKAARAVKQRRPVGRRINQHIGVDKAHRPSSS